MEDLKLKTIPNFKVFIEDEKEKMDVEKEEKKTNNENFKGLSSEEAQSLLKQNGENSIASEKNVSAVKIFAGQFKDFLVLILLVATVVSIFMGELVEAVSILVILFLNAIMGFIQEYKTEKTLEALDNMITPNAKVFRDGKISNLLATKIVKGDLIFVKAGDTVSADAVILESKKLEVDESILTGESISIAKEKDLSLDETNELNKKNIIYMGTAVVKGECIAKVVATGKETQMGKIASMLENISNSQTPLQKKLGQMGKFIITACLLVSFIVIVVGILRGEAVLDMVITGLSLAVASVPEGLPAIVTIALAFAVKHMIRKKALIRKLHAVETLGCANIICTDKTGTLTQNKMTVKKIVTANFEFDVTGQGLSKEGSILIEGEKVSLKKYPFLKDILINSVVCNGSTIFTAQDEEKSWSYYGEPTEVALLVAAFKAGVNKDNVFCEVFDEMPFDSSKKFMIVFAKTKDGRKFVFVKGAYDVIAKKCRFYKEDYIIPFRDVERNFNLKNEKYSSAGMRVLAFAYKELDREEEIDDDLTFLGLCAMLDPPRKEVKSAIHMCRLAGIKTVMITGDSIFTATAIAKNVGIYKKGDFCIEGKDLDEMDDAELKKRIKNISVFARVSPKHKLRIVKAFKETENVVAMTGDGVNDAPAVKEADIGVCMGISGSEVTKQAADVVLLDDNFSTLVNAVEEGRTIYKNIRKFMRYLLSCNIGEVLTSLIAILMGMPIPLLPIQILLINLVTDSLPAICLGLEPKEKGTMESPPRDVNESIFSKGLMATIVLRGFLIAITTLFVFTTIFRLTLSIDLARTATFLTLVSSQLIHVFECKSETKSIFKINYLNNKKLLFSILISFTISISAVFFSPFNKIIKNYPLNFQQTSIVVLTVLVVPFINAIFLTIKNIVSKKRSENEVFKIS